MFEVAVGIIERNGSILVCQRKKGARYELKWEFPGGKVKKGEDLKDSLKRELFEELNITAEIGDEVFRQQWKYADKGEFDVHFFLIKKFSEEPQNMTFEHIRWVSPESLGKLDLLHGSKGVLQYLRHFT